jgi:hypothetical protein
MSLGRGIGDAVAGAVMLMGCLAIILGAALGALALKLAPVVWRMVVAAWHAI